MISSQFRLPVLMALAIATTASVASENVKFQLGSLPGSPFSAIYVAKSKGLYEKAGIEVEVLPGKTSQDAVNAVDGGNATIAVALATNVILSASKGMDVLAIGSLYGRNVLGLVTSQEPPITSLKQLAGHKVLVPGGTYQALMWGLMSKQGVDKSTAQYILLPQPSAMLSSYTAGQAEAVLTVLPFARAYLKRPSNYIDFADNGDPEPGYVFVVKRSTFEARRDLFARLLRATYSGLAMANADPETAITATLANVPTASAAAERPLLQAFRSYQCSPGQLGKPTGFQVASDWTRAVQVYQDIGLIEKALDPQKLYSNILFEGKDTVSADACK